MSRCLVYQVFFPLNVPGSQIAIFLSQQCSKPHNISIASTKPMKSQNKSQVVFAFFVFNLL